MATRKSVPPMMADEVSAHLRTLCSFDVLDVTSDLVFKAVHRSYESRIGFYDALVVEAAIAGGAEVLYSEDLQHGMQFDSLRIVNPFL